MDGQPERLVIYPSRWKTAAVFAGGLVFVAIGVAIGWFRREMGVDWVSVVIASYLGVPFFGACTAYALYRLVVRRPALVLDAAGLHDNASAIGVGFLAWDEVRAVVAYKTSFSHWVLGVVPADLEAVLARQGRFKRALLRMQINWERAPINIPQGMLPVRVQELAERIVSDYAPWLGFETGPDRRPVEVPKPRRPKDATSDTGSADPE